MRSDRVSVSARTQAALAAAVRAGIVIVVVSARGPRGAVEVVRTLGLAGLAICSNGAVVLDLESKQVVSHQPLAAEVAGRLVRSLRVRAPGISFAAEGEARIAFEPEFRGAWDGWEPPADTRYADALELVAQPITKLVARHAGHSIDALAALAREVAGEEATVSVFGEWVIEIAAEGVNKAAALAELADKLGIPPEDVMAFGDHLNDLPMLGWAGRAIAPANAHPTSFNAYPR